MGITVLVWIIASVYLSYIIGRFLIKKSQKFSFNKSNQSAVRFGSQATPIYGGVIFYIIFILSTVFSLLMSNDSVTINHLFIFLLVGTIGFFIGLADDLLSPSPFFKFFGQSLVAITLILLGVTTKVSDSETLNSIITFIWVIGIMNSINLLDNMDAVSSTVSTLIFAAVIGVLLFSESINFPIVILLAGIVGSLLGFLKFNWNPSKMYMGDNGSQFLGAVLAVVGIMYFWNNSISVEISVQKSFWATVLAFIIPIIDTTTVFVNRIMRGQSPFVGGRDHTTHHLYYLGLSVKQVTLLLDFLTVVSLGLSVYIIKFVDEWTIVDSLIFGGYSLVLFTIIYSTTKISKPKVQNA